MTDKELSAVTPGANEMSTSVTLTPAELDIQVSNLSYEDARSKLVEIVSRLEQGNLPLEETVSLWELGEALARRCEAWLDGARERLNAAREVNQEAATSSNEQ